MKRFLFVSLCTWSIGSFAATPSALSQDYPSKPIRMIVPLVPGGGTDIAARITGQRLTERWGQQVIVDNRPGAGGNIGADIVSRATSDGHTLLVSNPGPIVVNPWLFSKLPFDPAKDFTPVVMLAPTFYVLITNPSVPANSVRELIQFAQKQPGKLVLASGGIGAPSDLMGEMFKILAKVDAVTVQYKGGGQAIADVLFQALTLIRHHPGSAGVYAEPYRRMLIRDFPFGVFYEEQTVRIVVVAVVDLRQDPGAIQRRLFG